MDAPAVARVVAQAKALGPEVWVLAESDPGAFREALVGMGARLVLLAEPVLAYDDAVAAIMGAARR